MNPRQAFRSLRRKAAIRLLSALESIQLLTDRLVAKVEAHAVPDQLTFTCTTYPANAPWQHLLHRPHLPWHEARRLVCEDELATARVFQVAAMKPKLQRSVDLRNYAQFRAELVRLGEWSVPLEEPPPVDPMHLVDCHFDFEMPEDFAENPAGDPIRSPFHIELDS